MRNRWLMVAGSVVLVAVVVVVWYWMDTDDGSFSAGGQDFDCGSSGQVRVDATVFFPGPHPGFLLDGRPLAGYHPHGGDPAEFIPVSPPVFPCSDGDTHRLQLLTDHPNTRSTGCQIRLIPAVQTQYGKHAPEPPPFDAGEWTCDLSWTD